MLLKLLLELQLKPCPQPCSDIFGFELFVTSEFNNGGAIGITGAADGCCVVAAVGDGDIDSMGGCCFITAVGDGEIGILDSMGGCCVISTVGDTVGITSV